MNENDYAFDAAGNTPCDPQLRKFTYDAENKQTKVETVNSSGTVTGTIGEYFYDGDGRRVKKIAYSNNQVTETTVFVYDASSRLVAEYSTILSPTPQVAYLTNDHLGSPRVNTNERGAVISRHDYRPYGEEITERTHAHYVGDTIRKQFTGYERDGETDLDFAQARHYDSRVGRFTSVDPIILTKRRIADPQELGAFSYVRNNPEVNADPTGEEYVDDRGRKIDVEKREDGTVAVSCANCNEKSKEFKNLLRLALLINEKGSSKAISQFMKLANSTTKLHLLIEQKRKKDDGYGLAQPHDTKNKRLKYDYETGGFQGSAEIKNSEYVGATITLFEGNINRDLEILKGPNAFKDSELTTDDILVATFAHEAEHVLDRNQVEAVGRGVSRKEADAVFHPKNPDGTHMIGSPWWFTFQVLREIKAKR